MLTRRRSGGAFAIVAALGLAACGGGSTGTQSAPASDAPLPEPTTSGEVFSETDGESIAAEPQPDAPVTEPVDAAEPVTEPEPETEVAAEPASDVAAEPEAEVTAEPEPEPVAAEPAPAVLGGRALTAELQAAANFDGNPFPDLIVNDVSRDTQVNIRNILPSDRPVLLWSWAPH